MSSAKSPRAPRLRRRLALHFGAGEPLRGGGFTTNVSPKGVGFTSHALVTPGARLQLRVQLPEGFAVLEGRVAWAHRGSQQLGLPNSFGVSLQSADGAWARFLAAAGAGPSLPDPEPVPKPIRPARPPEAMDTRAGRPRLRRHAIALHARFDRDSRLQLQGTTVDVSAMGLGLTSASTPTPGETLWLALDLPDGSVARVEGVVVRRGRAGAAEGPAGRFAVRVTRADEAWYRFVQSLSR